MHIKQVVIEGFKSYKEQVATDEFSARHNAVVGANGSGKSNFFQAIRFVLSDLFQSMPPEERRRLLHEGAGSQVMTAFVEIVFDNEDNRIPVDRDEVRLRRTIGLKKDEYYLDGKHITKAEVINLLESAGFSRSNPYYIVQQGKITAIATLKDNERLEMLKEIGGTSVYEDRRAESIKTLHETEAKRTQIREVVQYIEERLSELDEEREELAKFQQLDKQRRSLEYSIHDAELTAARQQLDDVEEKRRAAAEKSNEVHDELSNANARRKEIEKELKAIERDGGALQKEKASLQVQKQEAVRARARLELDVKELAEKLDTDRSALGEAQANIGGIEAEIAEADSELATLRDGLSQEKGREAELGREIVELERALSQLYQKQGRSSQFASRKERDAWIEKEVKHTEDTIAKKVDQVSSLKAEIAGLERTIAERAEETAQAEAAVSERERMAESTSSEASKLRERRDELNNKRRELWRRDSQLDDELKQAQKEITQKEKQLEFAVARDINRGLLAVKRIVRDHSVGGVHGALIELLDCDERFNTAVEVTAGNSLFHVVVETDEVASRIIHHLNQEKGGRISFMPLNRIKDVPVEYPKTQDAVPLVSKLKFHSRYKAAMNQVFAKTLICRDLDVATNLSRTSNLNCVTMDGDTVNKKGALSGGYHDQRRSRLGAMKGIKELTKQCNAKREESSKLKDQLQELDQEISKVLGEFEKQEAKRTHLREQSRQVLRDLSELRDELSTAQQSLEQRRLAVAAIEEGLSGLQKTAEDLRAEKGTEMLSQLTSQEQSSLQRLDPQLRAKKEEAVSVRERRMEADARVKELEARLKNNLVRQRDRHKQATDTLDVAATEEALASRRAESTAAEAHAADLDTRLKDIDVRISTAGSRTEELKAEEEKLRVLTRDDSRRLQDDSKEMEKLLGWRSVLQQRKDDAVRKIRELGSLPAEAFEKYRGKASTELHRLLAKTNEKLKQYAHVNKKALDQYVGFSEEKEVLTKRVEELNKAHEKIQELLSVLDQRKDECIERTFKQVAIKFREVFSELVPSGKGQLVMQKKRMAEDAEQPDTIEKYAGVKIKVSFGAGETLFMEQLSGGQKTVVALAMIFAIQRCDPAAFYLFDEIDAALDSNYRQAVADMIKAQAASGVQYITTTFRPELVKVADSCFGVSHAHRISNIEQVSREDALAFLADAETEPDAGAGP